MEDLDGDFALVLQILGEIDRGHSAAAELAFDGVAVGEGRGEAREDLTHGCWLVAPLGGFHAASFSNRGLPLSGAKMGSDLSVHAYCSGTPWMAHPPSRDVRA